MTMVNQEYAVPELLENAGCTLRGRNRSDCAWCKGRRTISYTDEVYCCHRCGAKGNSFTLARELGLAPRLSRAEAQAMRLEKERAEAVANAFLARVRAARFGLTALHMELLNLRDEAHERLKANHDDETAWEILACICSELPRVRAELILLSDGTVGDRVAWFEGNEERRREIADCILRVSRVPTFDGKWAEVGEPAPDKP